MDLTSTIIPKSDQINADDLISGPRTFTIKGVRPGSSEQPVNIDLVEFPGRPFRPSKTVLRILVTAWGRESEVYTGRRLTLYNKPDVRFGGNEVGGIRVSHLSDIDKPIKLALTKTRGQKETHVVQPLPANAPVTETLPEGRIAPGTQTRISKGLDALGITTGPDKLDAVQQATGRDVKSARDLTVDEGEAVLAWIAKQQETPAPVAQDEPANDGMWPTVAPAGDAA